MSKVSEMIKDCIAESGYTLTELSKKTGIFSSNLSEYLSGKHAPTFEHFVALLYAFGCSADYLLGIKELDGDESLHTVPPFGERLREVLRLRGVSQAWLCRQTGISTAALYYWLSNRSSPSLNSLLRMAGCLECSVDYLIGRVR